MEPNQPNNEPLLGGEPIASTNETPPPATTLPSGDNRFDIVSLNDKILIGCELLPTDAKKALMDKLYPLLKDDRVMVLLDQASMTLADVLFINRPEYAFIFITMMKERLFAKHKAYALAKGLHT